MKGRRDLKQLLAVITFSVGVTASGSIASAASTDAPRAAATRVRADTVINHARIFTSNPAMPWAEALAIADGKIIAVGSNKDVGGLVGDKTAIIEGRQRLIVPGIIDAHLHLAYAVKDSNDFNCLFSPQAGLDKILSAVEECAKNAKPGEWIAAKAWDSSLLPELSNVEALHRLDRISPNNPVIMRSDTIHDRWVNSVALKMAGITAETKDPPRGKVGRDPKTGELNGLLIESSATELIDPISPLGAFAAPENVEQLKTGVKTLNGLGVTGWNDALVPPNSAVRYKELDDGGDLHARVGLSILVDPNKMKTSDLPALFKEVSVNDGRHISTRFAKIFLDGTPVSRTADVLHPYMPDAEHGSDYHGSQYVSQVALNEVVTALDAMGISVKMHATGEASVREALNAVAAARKANGNRGPMHTIAHAGHVAPEDVPRFGPLRAAIDASPTLWYPGSIMDAVVGALGKERGEAFFLFRTDLRAGAFIAGGTDWKTLPDEYSDLWSGVEGMVTRRNPTGRVPGALHPEEAIDLATVIRIYTINSATALRIDRVAGSLQVGKSADFAILNQDIFARPPECISKTRSVLTMFEGKVVYQADEDGQPSCN